MPVFWSSPRPLLTMCVCLCLGCAPSRPAEDSATESETADPNAPDSSGQSYAQAIGTVCDADRLSGANPDDPLEATNQRNDYLVQHVKNADGIYFLTVFRTQTAAEQAEALGREVKAVKLAQCALLEALRAEAPAREQPPSRASAVAPKP